MLNSFPRLPPDTPFYHLSREQRPQWWEQAHAAFMARLGAGSRDPLSSSDLTITQANDAHADYITHVLGK